MKTFFNLLIAASLFASSMAMAAKDCRMNLNTYGGGMSAMNDLSCYGTDAICNHRYQHLVKILADKGYVISTDADAPFKLRTLSGSGSACGTGMKWYDYAIISVSSEMSFTGNGTTIGKEHYGVGIAVGAPHRAVVRTFKFVENYVPSCE